MAGDFSPSGNTGHLNRSHSSKRLVKSGGPIDFERRAEAVRVLSRGIKSAGILR